MFGEFTTANNNNIEFCHIKLNDHFTPAGCSFSVFVSNNNGSTWESYTLDSVHAFSSTGTQLKVKYTASGQADKAPYKMSFESDQVTCGTFYEGFSNAEIPTKVVKRKFRRRRF